MINAEQFLRDFSNLLKSERKSRGRIEIDLPTAKARTFFMKGDSSHRPKGVLTKLLSDCYGYLPYNGRENVHGHCKIIGYEWNDIDIIAATGFRKNWKESAWAGDYQYNIAIEVENRISEFQMTIRGLLNLHCELYVGIFMVDYDSIQNVMLQLYDSEGQTIPAMSWCPSSITSMATNGTFRAEQELLTIFLCCQPLKILSALKYRLSEFSQKGIELIPSC